MTKNLNTFNRTLLTSVTLATLLLSSSAFAKKAPGAGDRERISSPEQRFERLDSNADGLISLDEFTANIDAKTERRFSRKDRDDDGFLSLEEATRTRRGEAPDHTDIATEIVACVAEMAAENTLIQIPEETDFASPEERFNLADTTGDGFLSLEEVQNHALSKAITVFETMDSDASGDVNLEELTSHAEQRKATRQAIRNCINELENDPVI